MLLAYRLLGLAASIGSALSRIRLNFVPLSVLPLVGLAACMGALFVAVDSYREGRTPHKVTLGELAKEDYSGYHFVSVQGVYDPDVAFIAQSGSKFSTREGSAYVALTDPATHGSVMVQMPPGEAENIPPGPVTVSGMLDFAKPELYLKLPETVGGGPISRKYFLDKGATPDDPGNTGLMGIAIGIPCAFYAVAFFRMYVIFRKTPDAEIVSAPTTVMDFDTLPLVRATGRFWLHTGASSRFLDVPAVLSRLENGEIGIFANVDASRSQRIYGIQVSKEELAGYWVIAMNPVAESDIEIGEQYADWKPRPAIRLRYRGVLNSYLETAILAFDSPEDRLAVIRALLSPVEEPFVLS